MAEETVYYATGKRKTSAARIFLKKGTGQLKINGKSVEDYVNTAASRISVHQAFAVTDTKGKFDVYITVKGGGTTGQVEAIRHGLARALVSVDEGHRPSLKKAGYLTRDSRMVERKKYGLKKSRKSSQFSKR